VCVCVIYVLPHKKSEREPKSNDRYIRPLLLSYNNHYLEIL
jgi:hypothetical protein